MEKHVSELEAKKQERDHMSHLSCDHMSHLSHLSHLSCESAEMYKDLSSKLMVKKPKEGAGAPAV